MRMLYGIVEEGIVKWLWGSLGLCVCAVPVFGSKLFGGMGGSNVIDFGSRTEGKRDSLRPWRTVQLTEYLS
jgi:ATP-binding cassette subfamily D (ALD) long-chain fatty acid import protein